MRTFGITTNRLTRTRFLRTEAVHAAATILDITKARHKHQSLGDQGGRYKFMRSSPLGMRPEATTAVDQRLCMRKGH